MLPSKKFPAFIVRKVETTDGDLNSSGDGPAFAAAIEQISLDELDAGEVVVRVVYSALNYKDALAAKGNRGVVRKIPLVIGIDAVGEVVESGDDRVAVGDKVLIADASFGTAHHGGLAAYVRVPADWVYVLPAKLTILEAVAWGTAGFTAAQSVEQILHHGIGPDSGDILVTGATGGVGIFAVKLLAKLGFRVVASTGKKDKRDWLVQHGAAEVITRAETVDETEAPLLKSRWAGAVDSVGGATLASVLRAAKQNACVTACGLVAGHELELTVYPFILRGVTLSGIDSANISRETRIRLWEKIASDWKLDVTDLIHEIKLDELSRGVEKIMAGSHIGRTIVKIHSA